MRTSAQRWRMSHAQCPLAPSLSLFLAAFLSYSNLFYLQKFNLTFIQKRCVCQKLLFVSNKINFCCKHFLLKIMFANQNQPKEFLILIKQNLFNTLYFSMIIYFVKALCSEAQEIRYALFFLIHLIIYLTSVFTEFA